MNIYNSEFRFYGNPLLNYIPMQYHTVGKNKNKELEHLFTFLHYKRKTDKTIVTP